MSEWFWGLSMDVRLGLFILGVVLGLGAIFKLTSRSSRHPFDY